ncbi:hypothetical protein AKO1_002113, partial [Acrasis kona]
MCPPCQLPICETQPVTMRSFNNMLDKIMVQCKECFILTTRKKFLEDHVNECPNAEVVCISQDLGCTWSGPKSQLTQHEDSCPFAYMRPVFDHLKKKYINELKVRDDKIKKLEAYSQTLDIQTADYKNQITASIGECEKLKSLCICKDDTITELRKRLRDAQLKIDLHEQEKQLSPPTPKSDFAYVPT